MLSLQAAPTAAGATHRLPELHTSPLWHSSLLPDGHVAPDAPLAAHTPHRFPLCAQKALAHWLLSPQVAPSPNVPRKAQAGTLLAKTSSQVEAPRAVSQARMFATMPLPSDFSCSVHTLVRRSVHPARSP